MTRKPADPEEELRWMAQEVRGYVEAVLNSLAANVPKVSLMSSLCPSFLFSIPCLTLTGFSGSCSLPSRKGQRGYA